MNQIEARIKLALHAKKMCIFVDHNHNKNVAKNREMFMNKQELIIYVPEGGEYVRKLWAIKRDKDQLNIVNQEK